MVVDPVGGIGSHLCMATVTFEIILHQAEVDLKRALAGIKNRKCKILVDTTLRGVAST